MGNGATLRLPEHLSDRLPHRALAVLPDARLARLAAEGSRGAFAAIYERHHQALYRYCRSILGNDDEAKDALQNTMVSALRSLPGERRRIALKPWLFRVAHNESISVLRRRTEDAELDEVALASSDDIASRERLRGVFEDLTQLPERQRGALVMRELTGLGYTEIAEVLETSDAAAKQMVYEARCALHELEEGRQMECDAARVAISARDGRMLRGRKLRAHLRACDSCRSFRESIAGRRNDLKALAPPLPAPAAAAVLSGILGGGGGAGGGGIAALATGAGAAGGPLAGTAAIKAVAITVAAGLGIAGAGALLGSGNPVSSATIDMHAVPSASPSADRRADGNGPGSHPGSHAKPGSGGPGHGSHPGTHSGPGGGSQGGHGGGQASGGSDAGSGTPGGSSGSEAPVGQAPPIVPGGSTGGGSTGGSPPSGGSTGHGPIGTPPGQGGVPPGQGGVPPGLAQQPPGLGGTPPGQGGTPPGQAKTG